METVRFGIIGIGNMGMGHARNFMAGKIENGILTAVCDLKERQREYFRENLLPNFKNEVKIFDNADEMMASGLCDAVMIAIPHYDHPTYAIKAVDAGLHAIVEKPAGVYTKQVEEMLDHAKKSDRVLSMMFNQRTNPAFLKMRELVASGAIGEIKRTNWIITNWYRSQQYYDSGEWRATWEGEGGGVLYNQAPHQLDLFQWIVGMMPTKIRAFCHFGQWHNIEVEDDVTAYVEYPNGATGVFITTTADAPGTNRFEITGTKGTLIYETRKLTVKTLGLDEREYCFETKEGFPAFNPTVVTTEFPDEGPQHVGVVQNVVNTILGKEKLFAPAEDGLCGVMLANAMHLSTWLGETVTLPFDSDLFYNELLKRIDEAKKNK